MKGPRAEIKMMNFPCFLDNFAAKKEKDKSRFSLCFKFRILINVLRGGAPTTESNQGIEIFENVERLFERI